MTLTLYFQLQFLSFLFQFNNLFLKHINLHFFFLILRLNNTNPCFKFAYLFLMSLINNCNLKLEFRVSSICLVYQSHELFLRLRPLLYFILFVVYHFSQTCLFQDDSILLVIIVQLLANKL